MLESNKPGRPPSLNEATILRVVDAVPKVYVQNQVAAMAGIPKSTFSEWLALGYRHMVTGEQSIYAQLSNEYLRVRTKLVQELLQELRTKTSGQTGIMWILERCFREDFGAESEEFKVVLAELLRLKEDYMQLKDELIKKGKRHG